MSMIEDSKLEVFLAKKDASDAMDSAGEVLNYEEVWITFFTCFFGLSTWLNYNPVLLKLLAKFCFLLKILSKTWFEEDNAITSAKNELNFSQN